MTDSLRLATRGSRQAWAQSTAVARQIEQSSGRAVRLVRIDTTGDQQQNVPLHSIGGQGVFVKEVQRAVLDGRADLAVHSAKDLPTDPVAGLRIAAFTERRDARDALIGSSLAELASGATVATGSVRRRAQLIACRPDLHFVELRGNIETRLGRIPPDGCIVMAVAALQILDLTSRITEVLPIDPFVPAVGQGCVAVEARDGDVAAGEAVSIIDHEPTRHAVEVERAFLAELGSGCSLPVGAHVADLVLHSFLGDPDTGRIVSARTTLNGSPDDIGAARSAASAARDTLG